MERIENTLPGHWKIVTYMMPANGLGIYYNGAVIYQDTILTDVGRLEFPTFIAEHVDSDHQNYAPLPFILNINDEEFIHEINHLIPRQYGAYMRFRKKYNNPVSENEKFVSSSSILDRNKTVIIENENRIIIVSATGIIQDSVILERMK